MPADETDARTAHEAYYKAGILHGHIDLNAIMRVADPARAPGTRGVLVDLDPAVGYAYKTPQEALQKTFEKHTASGGPAEREENGEIPDVQDAKSSGEGSTAAGATGTARDTDRDVLGRGMRRWLASA